MCPYLPHFLSELGENFCKIRANDTVGYDFRENRRREGRTFLTFVNEITFILYRETLPDICPMTGL
jgi:hypothetical protein